MDKNKSILATIITVLGGIIVAIITNAEKISLISISGTWLYIILVAVVVGIIWGLHAILTNKNRRDTQDHPIFTQFIYGDRYLNKVFELEDKGKELLFRELLNAHIESFRSNLMGLHDRTKSLDNIVEFKNEHVRNLYQIIDCLEKHFYSEAYSDEDVNLLKLVIPKFNKGCSSGYKLVVEKIEEICDSNLYRSNISRNIVILLSYQIMISIIILNANKTLNELNGELSGRKFKGVLIS